MPRRTIALLITLTLAILVAPLAAEAQPTGKVYQIGRLITGVPSVGPDPPLEAFQQGLRDLGYVEGQNLVMEQRYAQSSPQHPGSVPFSMNADEGGLWNNEGGIFGKEVRINSCRDRDVMCYRSKSFCRTSPAFACGPIAG
jgi:hypothetical protein